MDLNNYVLGKKRGERDLVYEHNIPGKYILSFPWLILFFLSIDLAGIGTGMGTDTGTGTGTGTGTVTGTGASEGII
jgi:hypothetical protein